MAEVDAASPSSLAAQWAQLRELRRYFEQAHSALFKAELLAEATMAVCQTSYLDAAAPGQQRGPQRGGCLRRCADPDLVHAVELLEDALPRALDRPSLGRLRGAARRLRPLARAAGEADGALNSSGSEEKPVGSSGAIPEIASSSSSLPSVAPGNHVQLDVAATGGDSSEVAGASACSDSRQKRVALSGAELEVASPSAPVPPLFAAGSPAESDVAATGGEDTQVAGASTCSDSRQKRVASSGAEREVAIPSAPLPFLLAAGSPAESDEAATGGEDTQAVEALICLDSRETLVASPCARTDIASSSTSLPSVAFESHAESEGTAASSERCQAWLVVPRLTPHTMDMSDELESADKSTGLSTEEARTTASSSSTLAPPATGDSGESEQSLETDAAGSGEAQPEACTREPPADGEVAKSRAGQLPQAEVEDTGKAWLLVPPAPADVPDESDRAAGPSVEEARAAASSSSSRPAPPEAPSPAVDCGEREPSLEAEVEDNGEAPSPAVDCGEREQLPEAEVEDNREVLPEAPSPAVDCGERERSLEAEVEDNTEVLPEAPSPVVDSGERERSLEAEVEDSREVLPEAGQALNHLGIRYDQGEGGDSDALECEEDNIQELRRQLSEALERPRLQREDAAEDAVPRAEGEGGVAEGAVAEEDLLPSVDQPGDDEGKGPEYEQVWRVVGSRVLVRCDMTLDSSHVTRSDSEGYTDRIATGSLVREVDVRGMRLKYELLVPAGRPGPLEGWVSISTADKKLLVKESEPPGLRQGWLPRVSPGLQMPYAPRIIWTYWDQGVKALPVFHQLCIQSWRKQLPTWRIEVVGQESIRDFVGPEDLPNTFEELTQRQHRADCARSALLCRYGGVYMDPTILAWRDIFKTLPFHEIEEGRSDYVGFFRSSRYMVENWFMACRKGCELVEKWHQQHLAYWKDRRCVNKKFNRDLPFFSGVDFSNFGEDELTYLAQHACYLKLMTTDTDFRKMAYARAKLFDSWTPQYGGLYINKKLKECAGRKAHVKATQRNIQNNKLDKGSCIHTTMPMHNRIRLDVHRRLETQEDIEDSLWTHFYWEDDLQMADQIVELPIPFAKFTSPLNDLLRRLRLRDIRRWPSTLRRLVVLALGEEYKLPMPPGGRPARVKGQLV